MAHKEVGVICHAVNKHTRTTAHLCAKQSDYSHHVAPPPPDTHTHTHTHTQGVNFFELGSGPELHFGMILESGL